MAVIAGIDLGSAACRVVLSVGGDLKPVAHRFDEGGLPPILVGSRGASADAAARFYLPFDFASLKQKAGADPGVDQCITEVFAKIREDLRAAAVEAIDGVVITVPSTLLERPRSAIREAALDAGFPAVKLLDEALATVIGAEAPPAEGCHLLYALGAGFFSASVIRVDRGRPGILASAGNNALGGEFDSVLMRLILEKFAPRTVSRSRLAALKMHAERLKVGLSTREVVEDEIDLREFFDENGTVAITVSREEYEERIRGLVESTLEQAREALAEAGLAGRDLKGILVAGGATRIPLVGRLLAAEFNVPQVRMDSLCAARGAARQGILLDPANWKRREPGLAAQVNNPPSPPPPSPATTVPTRPADNGQWTLMFAPQIQEAEALWNSGKQLQAINALAHTTQQIHQYLGTLYQLYGQSLLHEGAYDKAVIVMQQAAKLNPSDKTSRASYHLALNRRSEELLREGRLKEAQKMILAALSLNPNCQGCLEVRARIERQSRARKR
jgi:actin-like ATPase involved in cell morphogenesis